MILGECIQVWFRGATHDFPPFFYQQGLLFSLLLACADGTTPVPEGNEGNNCTASVSKVTVGL